MGCEQVVLAERPLRLNVSWTFAGNVIYAACHGFAFLNVGCSAKGAYFESPA
jgi:hypothetical protein